jgi:hypothetical protein
MGSVIAILELAILELAIPELAILELASKWSGYTNSLIREGYVVKLPHNIGYSFNKYMILFMFF